MSSYDDHVTRRTGNGSLSGLVEFARCGPLETVEPIYLPNLPKFPQLPTTIRVALQARRHRAIYSVAKQQLSSGALLEA